MEKPVRKRGRPPITKEYSNPLESPMAHSSIKVQKLGAQSFSRPLMKVGQTTPSPRKRRTSSTYGIQAHCDSTNSAPGSTTKKGRYRGVLLTTPVKKNGMNRSTTASSTPSSTDSIFQSSSRISLKSSPPVPVWNAQTEKVSGEGFQQFKFALTIGENGRATIAGSSPHSSPSKFEVGTKTVENAQSSKGQSGISNVEKNRVLNLLRRMRNSTGTTGKKNSNSNDSGDLSESGIEMAHGLAERADTPESPNGKTSSKAIFKSPQPPSTPRATFAVKTGFTPNVGIDHVLLDIVSTPKAGLFSGADTNLAGLNPGSSIITFSPKTHTPLRGANLLQQQKSRIGSQDKEQREKQDSQRQQYVFKFLSADPLLLTDDVEGNWSELNYNQSQPSHHQMCFNTPPSWMNWGSPRAFSPQRLDSTGLSICQGSGVSPGAKEQPARLTSRDAEDALPSAEHLNSVSMTKKLTPTSRTDKLLAPTTPKSHDMPLPGMIECTPLIQQTMNGSLTARFVPGLLSGERTTEDSKDSIKFAATSPEQEDARSALKRLIAEK